MNRRTERLLRRILLFIDRQLDELADQESSSRGCELESASTPIRRVREKMDELALAIEFELQLAMPGSMSSRPRDSGTASALSPTSKPDLRGRPGTIQTGEAMTQELSPFQQMVDRWFADQSADEVEETDSDDENSG